MADPRRDPALRRGAGARAPTPQDVANLSLEEIRELVDELAVHQAELELQNEELRNLSFELAAVRDRFRDLFDFAPIGYVTLAGDGEILEANLAAGELVGCERAKLLGRRLQHFIAPEHQDTFHLHQQAVRAEGRARSCELVVLAQDGHSRQVAMESGPAAGAESRTHVALLDISQRVRAESALRDAKEELERAVANRTRELQTSRKLNEKIAEAVPLLLWIFDLSTRTTVYTNGFARERLGYESLAASAAAPVVEQIVPSDMGQVERAMAQLEGQAGEDSVEATFRIRTAQGTPRWVSSRIAVFERNPDGRLARILGASMDITELREVEERMMGLRREAAIATERERRDLAAMLHDSVGQLLPLANTKLALARRSCDDAISAQLAEVERVIREAHAAATSLTFRLNPPALREIGLIGGLQALAREMRRDHDLAVTIEDQTSGFALSEALEFAAYRVVHELLVNVAKHSGQKEARVRAARVGSRLTVIVDDRGCGFSPEESRIRGLGLTSAKERLGYLGASLFIQSKPQQGTRVELSIPLLEPHDAFAEAAK